MFARVIDYAGLAIGLSGRVVEGSSPTSEAYYLSMHIDPEIAARRSRNELGDQCVGSRQIAKVCPTTNFGKGYRRRRQNGIRRCRCRKATLFPRTSANAPFLRAIDGDKAFSTCTKLTVYPLDFMMDAARDAGSPLRPRPASSKLAPPRASPRPRLLERWLASNLPARSIRELSEDRTFEGYSATHRRLRLPRSSPSCQGWHRHSGGFCPVKKWRSFSITLQLLRRLRWTGWGHRLALCPTTTTPSSPRSAAATKPVQGVLRPQGASSASRLSVGEQSRHRG